MSEPTPKSRAAFAQIDERWDDARSERALLATHAILRGRKRRARALTAGAALSVAVVGALSMWNATRAPIARAPKAPLANVPAPHAQPDDTNAATAAVPGVTAAPAQRMQLADGSEIALLDAQARVVVKEVSPLRMGVELLGGRAHFEIVHREERVFRVLSGDVTVEVLGTSFELERDAARTRVSVVRGRVAVRWGDQRVELSSGEAGWFPKPAAPAADGAQPGAKAANPVASWREPAERGDFDRAYTLLARAKQAPLDDVEELMLAADTARISGHPAAALPFLNRVVAHHAHDARAPLAAFTLGGVLMQQLGRPREAEAAYARARELSLDSSLAQDALARQVEAAHRAGDAPLAARLATEYLARYPQGRRVHAVLRFGGLPPK